MSRAALMSHVRVTWTRMDDEAIWHEACGEWRGPLCTVQRAMIRTPCEPLVRRGTGQVALAEHPRRMDSAGGATRAADPTRTRRVQIDDGDACRYHAHIARRVCVCVIHCSMWCGVPHREQTFSAEECRGCSAGLESVAATAFGFAALLLPLCVLL